MRLFSRVCHSAFLICLTAGAALAQPHPVPPVGGASKVLAENEKVVVTDSLIKPGDVGAMSDRYGMVYYYVTGGSLERTFSDGSKDTVTRKSGEAFIVNDKRPYAGKTVMHLISIKLK